MQLYILQIPKPDAYIVFHKLTCTYCTCASIRGQTAWVSSTVQIYPKGLKSHQRLVKHWIRAELSLSEKTASEDNPTDSWRTLSRIQVHCFIFILLFVLFKSIVPDFKGNHAAFLVSLTDSGCCAMMDGSFQSIVVQLNVNTGCNEASESGTSSVHSLQYGLSRREIWDF